MSEEFHLRARGAYCIACAPAVLGLQECTGLGRRREDTLKPFLEVQGRDLECLMHLECTSPPGAELGAHQMLLVRSHILSTYLLLFLACSVS